MEILDELEGRRGLLEQIDNGVRLKFDRECRDPDFLSLEKQHRGACRRACDGRPGPNRDPAMLQIVNEAVLRICVRDPVADRFGKCLRRRA